ncbi:hypothetical protein CYLTODRAFT_423696 [Cylindrobasidium torrendii FP15055 ss-10]|uniref:Uncharacterized protein n=1 Tax=Cylindrobasidium torrendii FP15055 ss-10 TaxID=1314674 RepID=A0A0D7B7R1_9AGAR|nr:hypothetical protein CYLTODRAFT_423696 [Cylindrobasidium torrendii FP15055 ss-10]
MGKKSAKAKAKAIDNKLHSELVEYSSLMRALRNQATLDLSTQLSRAPVVSSSSEDEETEDDDDADNEASPGPSSPRKQTPPRRKSPSVVDADEDEDDDEYEPETGFKRKASPSESSPRSAKRRKTLIRKYAHRRQTGWTRWPLELEDVEKPTWTFEDEISTLISKGSGERDAVDSEDEEEEDELVAAVVPHLADSTTHLLDVILASVASYTQPRANSLGNRYRPMDWRFILNACATQRMVDPSIIARTEKRMLELYPSEPKPPFYAPERAAQAFAHRASLLDALQQFSATTNDILSIPSGVPPKVPVEMLQHEKYPELLVEGELVVARKTKKPKTRVTRWLGREYLL